MTRSSEEPRAPLFVIKGDADAEEVAAVLVAVQALAAGQAGLVPEPARSEWSAHHRKVRSALHVGPGGWRSSSLPH